jgi:prepilin-type N-terminal cleavage/methylation domain-containing protein
MKTFLKKSARRVRRGFSMIEVLLVLAVMGLLYYAFVLNNVGPVRAQATATSANALQAQIESGYGAWTALGGTHIGTLTASLANESMFAYDLLNVLTAAPGSNAANPPHFAVTAVADGSAAITPSSNTCRLQLAGAITDPGATGTQGVTYGPFFILAKPTTTSSAAWQVTSVAPTVAF